MTVSFDNSKLKPGSSTEEKCELLSKDSSDGNGGEEGYVKTVFNEQEKVYQQMKCIPAANQAEQPDEPKNSLYAIIAVLSFVVYFFMCYDFMCKVFRQLDHPPSEASIQIGQVPVGTTRIDLVIHANDPIPPATQ